MTTASIWDTDELSVFAGHQPNMRSFVNTVLQSRAFRDGVPPDAAPDADRRAWLEDFWTRKAADGTLGFRRIEGYPLSPEVAVVAENLSATMVQPPVTPGWGVTLRAPDNQVFLHTRVSERHLVIIFIIVARERRGLGRRICGLLADWAAANGRSCVASPVMAPEFFSTIGWRPLGGYAWGAPEHAKDEPQPLAA